jgi:hypothetical protein
MPNLNPFAALRSYSEKDRRWRRYKVDLSVRMKAWRGGAFQTVEGHGSDVCEGGLALAVPTDLQVGESVTLEVRLPYSEHPLMLSGAVRNVKAGTYGIEFVGLGEQQRQAIIRLCESLQKTQ